LHGKDKLLDTRSSGNPTLIRANHRSILDFALHFARRRGLDFVGLASIEPQWLRNRFCNRGCGVVFCRGKNRWPARASFASALHKFRRRFKRPAPLFFRNYPSSKFLERVSYAYACRSTIQVQRNWFKQDLPPSATLVGYATTFGGGEPALWLPFGERRVERVLPEDTVGQLRSRGIYYVVVEKDFLGMENETIEQWMNQSRGELLCKTEFSNSYGDPTDSFYLIHLVP